MANNITPSDLDEVQHTQSHHQPLRPRHAHSLVHRNLKRKREPPIKRQDLVQTALDVIVVSNGKTVGDVLLASLPSEPTTAILPGLGPLTLAAFVPATPTNDASTSTTASSPTSLQTHSNATSTLSQISSSSVAFRVGMAASLNGTSSASTLLSTSTSVTSTASNSQSSSSTSFSFTSFSTSTSPPSSTQASSSGGVIGGAAGGPTAPSGSSPTASPSNSDTDNSSTHAGPIAGGVVGGIGAVAVIAVLVFLLLRWWRKRQDHGQRLIGGSVDEGGSREQAVAGASSTPMTQRSSMTPFAAAVRRLRPDSTATAITASSAAGTAGEERGFQRVSGRKLTSVLKSGGDGYVEPSQGSSRLQPPARAFDRNQGSNLSGTSFYRDSNSHYGGTDEPASSQHHDSTASPFGDSAAVTNYSRNVQPGPAELSAAAATGGPSSNRNSSIYEASATGNPFANPPSDRRADRALPMFSSSPDDDSSDGIRSPTPGVEETLTMHQGPSRTPVVTSSVNTPVIANRRPDGLGRSRPSWDGSRHSRFSEAI